MVVFYRIFLLFFTHAGFSGDTFVWTFSGLRPLESLRVHDEVVSFDGERSVKTVISAIHSTFVISVGKLMIYGDDSPVFVSLDQRVYLPTLGIWKKVIDLQRHDIVFSVLRGHVAVQYLEVIHRPIRVIELSIDGIHNYFVGDSGILVHNVAPLLCVGFAWAFGLGSFEFLGVNASIAILGGILGLRLFRERHNRDDKEHTTLNKGHAQIKCDFNIDIKPVIQKVLAQEITHTSSNEEHATEYTQQGKNNPAEPQQPEPLVPKPA